MDTAEISGNDREEIGMDITVNHVWKSYGGRPVITDFSYRFPEGKTSCIMGESGCGKTTLLRMMLGLEQPDRGEITGVPHGKLGAVFQEDRLCENLSAQANIRLVCREKISEEKLVQVMAAMRLKDTDTDAGHKPVRELSGGMKRRIAVLRALMADSECIIMDEPLKGLDEETKLAVIQVIKKYTKGKTLIIVTHDKEEPALFGAQTVLAM